MQQYLLLLILFATIQSCKTVKSNFEFDKALWATDWSPNNELIAIGGNWQELQLLSATDLEVMETYPIPNTITKIKWNEQFPNLLAVTTQISENASVILNLATKETQKLPIIGARGLDWNFSGTLLAVGDNEGWLSLFNQEGTLVRKIDLLQKGIMDVSWHPTENILVAVGSHISLYDFAKDSFQTIQARTVEVLMLCVDWHPSGTFFVTGDYGDFIENYPPLLQFWAATGENLKNIKKSKAEYRNLKWTKDGKLLATASDQVRLWDEDRKLLKSRAVGSWLWGIDWNATDSQLVVTSEDGMIIMLDKNLKIIQQTNN